MKRFLFFLMLAAGLYSCGDFRQENKADVYPGINQIESPASDSSAEPWLTTSENGKLFLSWVEKRGKESFLRYSVYKNESWAAPVTIASGKNWFVNWADYPVLATDGKAGFLAHYLEKSDTAKFTYDIKITASADSGKTWSHPMLLNEDGKKAEHGFVSIVPYNDGFIASWLDGRKTASQEEHSGHEGHHGEMTVRAAVFDKNLKKINEWELDGRVCDCCQTITSITANGPVVIYRDRSEDEIRDMSIVRLVNGNWTVPVTIFPDNWKIKACPVNGPRADAIQNNLVIAWFTMKGKAGEVKVVFSEDGGASFGKPIRVDEGKAIGRVDVVMLDSASAIVSWMEGPIIKAVKVNANGKKGEPVHIASTSEKRSAGFPQMAKAGNRLYFAWTDEGIKKIRVAELKL
jgi:hypothetical protein